MSNDTEKFTPHKHAGIIKAWADGMPIQIKLDEGWVSVINPSWSDDQEYRVAPLQTHITYRLGLFKFKDYRTADGEEYYAVRAVELRYPDDQDFPTLGGELIHWLSASETIDLTDL